MFKYCALSMFYVFVLLIMPSAHSQDAFVQVIVNPSVATHNITQAQARRIFSMRQASWPNNTIITVYVMEDTHKAHIAFSTQVLGLFPYQLDRIWNKLVYSGLGEEPIKVSTEEEMLEKISSTPGAIGYFMNFEEIDTANVKILQVVKG